MELIEEFYIRRRLRGAANWAEPSARQVDAFLLLEEAVDVEIKDGQRNSRNTL